MSNLPGNPHANVNADYADTNDGRINGEAILALAYEQRTASLVALFNDPHPEGIPGIDYVEIARQIHERLGLGENK